MEKSVNSISLIKWWDSIVLGKLKYGLMKILLKTTLPFRNLPYKLQQQIPTSSLLKNSKHKWCRMLPN